MVVHTYFSSNSSSNAIDPSLYLNSVNNSNTSITYGTQSNFTATISNSSDYVSLYVNGTVVINLIKSKATYLKTLAAGLYKIIASTNTSGVANATYYEMINKATPTLTVTNVPGNFTYNGTKDNSSGLITTVNSQLSAGLYINGKSIGTTTSRLSYLNATAGMYAAVFNTSGNVNYTSYSAKVTSTISKAVSFELNLNGMINGNSSIIYGTASNFTAIFKQNQNYTPPNTQSILKNISGVSGPDGVAYDSVNNLVYVANGGSTTVSVINSSNESVFKTISIESPSHGVAYDSADNLIYVTNVYSNNVSVINASTESVIKTISVGSSPEEVAYDSVNNLVYVANNGADTVSVINASTESVIKTISVGLGPIGVAYDSADNLVYVANYGQNTVSVINPSNESVIKTISVGSEPYGVAYDSADNLIYVTNGGSTTVSVIDPSTESVIKTISVGSSPDAAAYDSADNRVYIANFGSNTVSVLNSPYIIKLYINSNLRATSMNDPANFKSVLAAGLYKITASTNVPNVSNVTYYEKINKAVLSQILKVFPSSFTYDGSIPKIQDTLNASIIPGNTITFTISNFNSALPMFLSTEPFSPPPSNNFVSVVSTSSSTEPFNFSSLPGKYASAGRYSYFSIGTSNNNYTVDSSPVVSVNINKATPSLTLTTMPSANYTKNATSLVFHFSVSTIGNQLTGSFYLNGSLKNSSFLSGTYDAGSLPNIFIGTLNTTGNNNYYPGSVSVTRYISPVNHSLSFNESVIDFNESRQVIPLNVTLSKVKQSMDVTLVPSFNVSMPLMNSGPFTSVSVVSLTKQKAAFSVYNLTNSSCYGNTLPGFISGINISTNAETSTLGQFSFSFSLTSNQINYSPYKVALYYCSKTMKSWEEAPTFLDDPNNVYNYRSVLTLYHGNEYAIGTGTAINSTNLTVEYFIAKNLPYNYTFNVTFDNVTESGLSQVPLSFETYPGTYLFEVYNLKNSSVVNGQKCTTYYNVTNLKTGITKAIDVGIPVIVNYSNSTECYPNSVSKPYNYTDLRDGSIYVVSVLVIIALLYVLMMKMKKTKAGKKSEQKAAKSNTSDRTKNKLGR